MICYIFRSIHLKFGVSLPLLKNFSFKIFSKKTLKNLLRKNEEIPKISTPAPHVLRNKHPGLLFRKIRYMSVHKSYLSAHSITRPSAKGTTSYAWADSRTQYLLYGTHASFENGRTPLVIMGDISVHFCPSQKGFPSLQLLQLYNIQSPTLMSQEMTKMPKLIMTHNVPMALEILFIVMATFYFFSIPGEILE